MKENEMGKCLVRERIDIEGDPRRSYMHKVWEDGLVQFYAISYMADPVGSMDMTEADWLQLAKTHPPQATYVNSEWGDGLPGAGDKWALIPANERGA